MSRKKQDKKIDAKSQKKDSEKKGDARGNWNKNGTPSKLKRETKHGILAVVCFLLALILILSMFHGAGPAGAFLFVLFTYLVGVGYPLLPLIAILLGYTFARSTEEENAVSMPLRNFLGGFLFLLSSLGLIDVSLGNGRGGILGLALSVPTTKLFGPYASILIMGAILLVSIFVIFDERPNLRTLISRIRAWIMNLFSTYERESPDTLTETSEYEAISAPEEDMHRDRVETYDTPIEVREREIKPESLPKAHEEEEFIPTKPKKQYVESQYVLPPLSLLEKDRGKPNTGDIKANANIIKRTLQNFGIEVEMDEITVGPTVTRYALKPAEGVKLSRIVALQSDLALALAAHPLRIEAPIPGKSLVGIEIPNKAKSIIGFASLLDDERFQHAPKPLTIALGRNISGKAIFANLAKMPHALIAGATGSGKSVTIHALITSLLYRNGPDDLRFIFVDPKRVELTSYNKIPHLLTPVITDPKKTIMALKWAAKEMERRYDILESHSVRDVESYHANVYQKWHEKYKGKEVEGGEEKPDRLPYIVIIIDELADIMQAYPRELEAGIVRLAQMSRAVGIHLILSTQRPSVNVITGLIKANIPARVALQVASQIDSRTILDQPGAEKLLGAGDMLYSSGEMASPERIQCAYISEEEVKKVVKFIIENSTTVGDEINLSQGAANASDGIFSATMDGDNDEDDLYEDARQTVIESGKASTSFLQRKLGIGYARAARLIDMLEERGIVGPGNGAKPREVLEKSVEREHASF